MKTYFSVLAFFIFLIPGKSLQAQDTIVKQNKEIVLAKVIEISTSEVKFKRFDLPDGPLFTLVKSEISKIKYSNGTVEEFNTEKKVESTKATDLPDLSHRYILIMNDGTQLKGKIISETVTEVVFNDNNIGERTIVRTKIKSLALEYGDAIRVFTLTDGSILTGKIINKTINSTVIETKELGIINLPESKIRQVREFEEATITDNGKIWFKNPNCTRYLYAPSAIPLKKGEGYYQNVYGAGNAVNFGLSNNISIGGGLVGPVGAYINTKVGFKLGNYVHIATGALLGNSFFPINNNNFGLGIGFGVFTIGNYDHNITVGAGYGFMNDRGKTKWQEQPIFVANGMARLGKKFALVTENWVINLQGDPLDRGKETESYYETFFSYAFRYMGQKSTLDAGFLNTPTLINKGWYIGIPYIGFVIRFGNYKED
ncbi:MAG: hypothetical protein ACT4ON_12940 [Bacteroidota bacterium]